MKIRTMDEFNNRWSPVSPMSHYRAGARLVQKYAWELEHNLVCPNCDQEPFNTVVITAIYQGSLGESDCRPLTSMDGFEAGEVDVQIQCTVCGGTVKTNMQYLTFLWGVAPQDFITGVDGVL